MRHSAGAWSGKTSEVPFVPNLKYLFDKKAEASC